MAWIKKIVDDLVNKYETNNPFELAGHLNINVFELDLNEEINGYYKYHRRNKYIIINSNLNVEDKRFVCSHELSHAILHPRANIHFMRHNTFFSIDKLEREANRFAAELLLPDDCLSKSNNIYEIASLHNVPVELARLKCEKLFY